MYVCIYIYTHTHTNTHDLIIALLRLLSTVYRQGLLSCLHVLTTIHRPLRMKNVCNTHNM